MSGTHVRPRCHAQRAVCAIASVLFIAGSGAALLSAAAPASGAPSGRPASGKVTVTDVRTTSILCAWVPIIGRGQQADFDSTLTWRDDGVTVSSANGDFSCALRGKGPLAAAAPCRFAVGGGRARTNVTCPAEKVIGRRDGDVLEVNTTSCRGVLLGCDVEADAQVRVTPK